MRFTGDLRGAEFDQADLAGAGFRASSLQDATFRGVWFKGVTMRGVELQDVHISGELQDVTINGVDVAPLVEAELDRRYPDRPAMRPTDAAGFRAAWVVVERLWAGTVERARGFDPDLLHASVGGEWSFVQTLRHLLYATETWLLRVVQGDPNPYDALSLPFDEFTAVPEVPWDRDARPTLDEVLALRRNRMDAVRDHFATLTDADLAADTTPVDGPGWPYPQAYPVRECLLTILNEEWHHRLYAERDLDALAAPSPPR